jgi:hypothetical protein
MVEYKLHFKLRYRAVRDLQETILHTKTKPIAAVSNTCLQTKSSVLRVVTDVSGELKSPKTKHHDL